MYLLVHHLYSKLPDQVVIVAKETSEEAIATTCVQALQKEAHFLSHGLRKLLNEHEQKQASGDFDDAADDDLRKVGEKFKRRQEHLRQNEASHLKVSAESLREFQRELTNIKRKTDLTYASCIPKT